MAQVVRQVHETISFALAGDAEPPSHNSFHLILNAGAIGSKGKACLCGDIRNHRLIGNLANRGNKRNFHEGKPPVNQDKMATLCIVTNYSMQRGARRPGCDFFLYIPRLRFRFSYWVAQKWKC